MKIFSNQIFKLAFVVLFIFITGCNKTSEKKENDLSKTNSEIAMKQDKLIDFGNNYTKAWNSQKPESVASFFAIDGSLTVNSGEPSVGREAITKFANGFMIAFPDLKLIMDSLITKPSRTEYYWTFIGTNSGPNGTGNKVRFSGVERWKFNEEGLIQDSQGSYNSEEYEHQLKYGVKAQ